MRCRFDDCTLKKNRLKQMAERRNVGYQTLLKAFVLEHSLYEEEKKGHCLPGKTKSSESPMRETRNAETG